MPRYRVTLDAKSLPSLQANLRKLGVEASIEKLEAATSRASRLGEAEGNVEDAKSTCEELKEEMETWRDSIPENLQSSDKASQIEDCISALEDTISNLEQIDFSGIDFPGMMG